VTTTTAIKPTTTATKPVPTHIKSVMDDAHAMGWDVECTPNSVKITPPKGHGVKPFTLSLTKVAAPPVLRPMLSNNGFTSAVSAWKRSKGAEPDGPEPKAEAPSQPEDKDAKLMVCPECKEKGVEEPFATSRPATMGAHRNRAHGVAGANAKIVAKRKAKATAAQRSSPAKKATAKQPPATKTAPAADATVPGPRPAAEVTSPRVQVNVDLLPAPVAEALGQFLTAVKDETAGTQALRTEVEALRAFRDQVLAEASDGNQPPVKALANIISLIEQTKQ
jgi:hypothetical protein